MELIALPTPERMFQATINYAKPPASGQFKIWQQHPAVSLCTQSHCSLLDFAHYGLGLNKRRLGGFALVIPLHVVGGIGNQYRQNLSQLITEV